MPFDVVYSRSLPNVAHIAAYWISKAINRPWIANFNDPWDLEATQLLPQDRHKRKRNVASRVSDFWLRRVMRTADILTFPSSRLGDYHRQLAVLVSKLLYTCDNKFTLRSKDTNS